MAVDPEKGLVAFLALKEIVENRPPAREASMRVLLELCTHGERRIRVMAIKTVLRWVPDGVVAEKVVTYALSVLDRLVEDGHPDSNGEAGVPADGVEPKIEAGVDAQVQSNTAPSNNHTPSISRYLTPATADNLPQHLELLLALSRRNQVLLQSIFTTYPKLSQPLQKAVENLIPPLIQSLGASPKLLEIMRTFPDGCEGLALKVVEVLGGEGLGGEVVGLVKSLMSERELDPRFVIPIIGDLDRVSVFSIQPA
jgi:symplekin